MCSMTVVVYNNPTRPNRRNQFKLRWKTPRVSTGQKKNTSFLEPVATILGFVITGLAGAGVLRTHPYMCDLQKNHEVSTENTK